MSTTYRSTLRSTFWQRAALSIILALSCWTGLESKASALDNPVPLISQPLNPGSVVPGGPGFTLTVNGTGFVTGSVVNWNGSPRSTQVISASQLTAQILSSDRAAPSTATVSVTNPAPGGGVSNAVDFEVTLPKSVPPFSSSIALAGQGGGSVVAGDFNGDGKIDLVMLNPPLTTSAFLLLLGKGDGTFQPPITTSLPAGPAEIVEGDFNGDGKLDLAMTENPSNQVEVVLGNGDGTFQPAQSFSAGTGPGAGIVAADFNGDGKLDLAMANQNDGTVSILLGNGDGTFQPPANVGGFITPTWIAVGDFNGDGKLDLAVTDGGSASVAILLGNGDGTFAIGTALSTNQFPVYVVTGDFNGDGKLDLAATDVPGSVPKRGVRVFLGNGDGTFQNGIEYASNADYLQMIAADMNGDGKLDLIAAVSCCDAHSGNAALLLGNGDGTFQAAKYYSANATALALAAGDFFADGSMDLAVSGGAFRGSNLVILLQTPAIFSPGSLGFQTLAVGSTSSSQTATLTNVGAGPLLISGRAVQGTNPGDFAESDDCPASLAQGAKCTVTVTFSPTSDGTRSAAVNFSATGAPKLQSLALKGIGTFAGLSPASLAFGSVPVGGTSQPQTVTLTNLSSTKTLTNVQTGVFGTNHSDFGILTSTCGQSLAPGKNCTVNIVFTPQATGSRTAHFRVALSGTNPPAGLPLSGTGT